jgi:hypothetical protein
VADEGGTWRVREATWESAEPADAGRQRGSSTIRPPTARG